MYAHHHVGCLRMGFLECDVDGNMSVGMTVFHSHGWNRVSDIHHRVWPRDKWPLVEPYAQ